MVYFVARVQYVESDSPVSLVTLFHLLQSYLVGMVVGGRMGVENGPAGGEALFASGGGGRVL